MPKDTMRLDESLQSITATLENAGVERADVAGIWTVGQMRQVLKRTYERQYPQNSALRLFPVTSELSPWARSFEYTVFDGVALAKIIADYTDDLPLVDALATQEIGKVFRFGNAWLISIDEIQEGAATGRSLSDRKSRLAQEAHDSLINRLVFKGSAPHKIVSVFNHPNITKIVSASWTTAEIASDELQDLVDTVEEQTSGLHRVNMILIPPSTRKLLSARMPETTMSYLDWFKQQNGGIEIEAISELENYDGAGNKAVLAYEKDEMNMSIEVPEAFNMLPMQPKDLHFKVPCTSKATGVTIYRPLTLAMLTGV